MLKYIGTLTLSAMIVLVFTMSACDGTEEAPLYKQKNVSTEDRIEDLLTRMTLEEKVDQLSGEGFDTRVNERLGIPALRMSDGPAGVRWGYATSFPAPVAMAASWDEDLLQRIGQVIGQEMLSKGRNFFLGPCVNIYRHPLGGRNFESFGEDPYLAARIAVPYINGVQSQGVLACIKHFALNNQEWERHKVDVKVSERALREIYLPAFKAAVQQADVWTLMAAYNIFRGDHCSESAHLLNDILKKEWGFNGFVVSDWGSVYSTAKAADNGLDLEMPWGKYFGEKLLQAVKNGEVKESIIDDKVRRLLRVRFESGIFDRKEVVDPAVIKKEAHAALAREVAEESIVLLKNHNNILPLDKNRIKTLAVLGPNAAIARTGGGGSSQVVPLKAVSALEGLENLLGDDVNILFSAGVAAQDDILPLPEEYLKTFNDDSSTGWSAEYFDNLEMKGEPVLERIDESINFVWGYDAPHPSLHRVDDRNEFAIRWKAFLTPPKTGKYKFSFVKSGGVRLSINGEVILDKWEDEENIVHSAEYQLTQDQPVEAVVEYKFQGGISQITFGWEIPGVDHIKEAAELAKKADTVILFTGLSNRFESESFDRNYLNLPQQEKLIKAVIKANPNTIVVNQTGAAILMEDWVEEVPAIIQAWYPGQEGGSAIADVLFGVVNPSGKLPVTFLKGVEQTPAFEGYKNESLIADYQEGIYVGYRYLDKNKLEPRFPFGHGLSYTSFVYSDLKVTAMENGKYQVLLKIRNSGERDGSEVVQVYVSDPESSVERPPKELKGFAKVKLAAGEEKSVEIVLGPESFKFYDEKENKWRLEPGDFVIMVGSSSRDIRISENIVIE